MSKDEFEETVKDLNDYYWALLVDMAFGFLQAKEGQKRNNSRRGNIREYR